MKTKHLQFARLLILWVVAGTLATGCSTAPEVYSPPPPVAAPPAPAPAPAPPPPAMAAPAPAPSPAPLEKATLAADTFFGASSVTLDAAARARIDELAQKVRNTNLEVVIAVGHADSSERPTHAGAMALSIKRAEAVKAYLVALGIEPNRVYTEGKGETQPIADNKTAGNRAKNRRVDIEVVGTRSASKAEPASPPRGHVPVLFATNRDKTGKNDPREYFGSNESEASTDKRLTLGRVTVRVPPNRQRGEIKEPGFIAVTLQRITSSALASAVGIPTTQAANPKTDFSFTGPIEEFTDRAFANELKESMKLSKSKSALVYVHGFANSFKDAAFRTAQFAYDLADEHYDVVPVLFSWPSDPAKINYFGAADRTWSAGKQLAIFLEKLTATTGAGVVHVVAHSKGAQVLGIALDTLRTSDMLALGQDGISLVPRFNQIILAAPDIRASDFGSIVLPAIASHHTVTNYVSSNDAALRASKKVNAGARAGDSGGTTIVIGGVETIDVTAVNYRPGGHSSFADSPRVIADIRQQLTGISPKERRLQRVARGELGYWLLKE